MKLHYESHFLEIGSERIHIARIYRAGGPPVLFLHGSIENGKVFYTKSEKGIAPYLADKGFDCYVVDMPGRGLSTPRIGKNSDHDLVFYIEKVIPLALEYARKNSGNNSISVVAHSWGGVILLAAIAIKKLSNISSLVFFGSKRRISIRSMKKVVMVDVVWRLFGRTLSVFYKYYPAKPFRLGSDNETTASFLQTDEWVRKKAWIYFNGQRDIAALLQRMILPPLLSITGAKDEVLGNPVDVQLLLKEAGNPAQSKFMVAGKSTGFAKDYGHIDIVTDSKAATEVYPVVHEWIARHLKQAG